MRDQRFPWYYVLDSRFLQGRVIFRYEGGYVAAMEAEGKIDIIVDEEGTMADFLLDSDPTDAKVLGSLQTVLEFDTVDERDSVLNCLRLRLAFAQLTSHMLSTCWTYQ